MKNQMHGNSMVGIVVVSVIVTAIVIGGGMYFAQNYDILPRDNNHNVYNTVQDNIDTNTQTETSPQTETAKTTNNQNISVDFSMDFPQNWGKVTIKDVTDQHPIKDKLVGSYKFTSNDDTDRSITINVIDEEYNSHWLVSDLPQTFIGKSGQRYYCYNSSGDHADKPGMDPKFQIIQGEVSQIIRTFRVNSQLVSIVNENSDENERTNWKTYINIEHKFSFQYPQNWKLFESEREDAYVPLVAITSPETREHFRESVPNRRDVSVRYFSSVENSAENKRFRRNATTIEKLIEFSDAMTKIGSVQVGDTIGTEIIYYGMGPNYVILLESPNGYYEIWFDNVNNKDELTQTHKDIISSFTFLL